MGQIPKKKTQKGFRVSLQGFGVPLKGSLKGSIRATTRVQGTGDLIIRIGFWDILYCTYDRNPENRVGNCLGPCIRV